MANFFAEERHTCTCGSILFKEENLFLLNKVEKNSLEKEQYIKIVICTACGTRVDDKHKII